jgi:hypothetical protein
MKTLLTRLLVSGILLLAFAYSVKHIPRPKLQIADTPRPAGDDHERKAPEVPQAAQMVTVIGPMANYFQRQDSTFESTAEPGSLRKPHPSDHIADSPVGTTTLIVRKTFAVTTAAKFPFEIPAHAATPQLRGTYRSFPQPHGPQAGELEADIDFLLMNEEQYTDFLRGGAGGVLFSVDSSHSQAVSFGLPATQNQAMKYFLVFRNDGSGAKKKVVQADFHVEF